MHTFELIDLIYNEASSKYYVSFEAKLILLTDFNIHAYMIIEHSHTIDEHWVEEIRTILTFIVCDIGCCL